jgi:uncharacterized membrane protein
MLICSNIYHKAAEREDSVVSSEVLSERHSPKSRNSQRFIDQQPQNQSNVSRNNLDGGQSVSAKAQKTNGDTDQKPNNGFIRDHAMMIFLLFLLFLVLPTLIAFGVSLEKDNLRKGMQITSLVFLILLNLWYWYGISVIIRGKESRAEKIPNNWLLLSFETLYWFSRIIIGLLFATYLPTMNKTALIISALLTSILPIICFHSVLTGGKFPWKVKSQSLLFLELLCVIFLLCNVEDNAWTILIIIMTLLLSNLTSFMRNIIDENINHSILGTVDNVGSESKKQKEN